MYCVFLPPCNILCELLNLTSAWLEQAVCINCSIVYCSIHSTHPMVPIAQTLVHLWSKQERVTTFLYKMEPWRMNVAPL